jgi:NitT/TauT family transport system permease protein
MVRQPISKKLQLTLGVLAFVLLATGYTLMSQRQHRINPNDTLVPDWAQIAEAIHDKDKIPGVNPETGEPEDRPNQVKRGVLDPQDEYQGRSWLRVDVVASFSRLIAGLATGVFVSVVLGLLMGCYAPIEAFFVPPMSVLAKIPPTAMLAVFFILVGTDLSMHVAMISFGIIPSLSQAVYQSAKTDVPEELIYKAYTLGASQLEIIWNVIFMQILPRVIEAVRLQVGPAMVYLIAAEMIAGSEGLGCRIRLMQRPMAMNVIYVYLAVLGLAGFLMDYSLTWLRRKLCPWFKA